MRITRCQCQHPGTLEEHYAALAAHDERDAFEAGSAMLSLLARLRSLPEGRPVYALTSINRLCLLSEDMTDENPRMPAWHVIVYAPSPDRYAVEYLLPDHAAPWPGAMVRGEAESEDEIVKMIVAAMEKSEGWKSS